MAEGTTWAAKASLISTRSMSSMLMPARAIAWRQASIGPRPMISGSRALTPEEMKRAIGVSPSSRARVSLITITAAAPSFSGQALPAVTVPSGRNTGFSSASFSLVVPARMPSSLATVTGLPSASTVSIGVISRSKKPRSWAAVARCCDIAAHSSCSSRLTFSYWATFSAVWPMPR